MRTSAEFVEILENYLKEKKISRRQFCVLVDIPNSTISSWKAKNVLPSIELVAKVAKFMNVSLDWLVYGEQYENANEFNNDENPCSRKNILYRIEIVLRQNNEDYDYDIESLHKKYLSNIVDYEVLINWVNGKANLPENVLPEIANKLKVSLQWLLTKDEYHQEDFDAHIYGLAKSHPGLLKGYDCLEEEDQKFIDNYITSKLELRQLKREKEMKNI
ncbi:helix-turn-helix transcriptional regulator [uncultured Treponema sp.]|uniref:helix-turn-helix domain-containing protein n=1 Tax=Treponema sp. TaxID=166 RepID=UPI0025D4A53C|nr:helix-turn-helix transcriptional regulator [uncultured Treponema sp.]